MASSGVAAKENVISVDIVDHGDGTFTLSGISVTDNGDGTFTVVVA